MINIIIIKITLSKYLIINKKYIISIVKIINN